VDGTVIRKRFVNAGSLGLDVTCVGPRFQAHASIHDDHAGSLKCNKAAVVYMDPKMANQLKPLSIRRQ
jgi:hypothetical protein